MSGLGGVIYGGLARGFLDMGLGVMAYRLTWVLNRCSGRILSVIEALCLLSVLPVLNIGFSVEDFKVLIYFPILIASVMTGKSAWTRLLNSRASDLLGKISYEVYLNHLLISTALTMYFAQLPYRTALMVYLVAILILAVMMYLFIDRVQQGFKKMKTNIEKR